jgi:hypothetical protein
MKLQFLPQPFFLGLFIKILAYMYVSYYENEILSMWFNNINAFHYNPSDVKQEPSRRSEY